MKGQNCPGLMSRIWKFGSLGVDVKIIRFVSLNYRGKITNIYVSKLEI